MRGDFMFACSTVRRKIKRAPTLPHLYYPRLPTMLPHERDSVCEEKWSNAAIIVSFIGIAILTFCYLCRMPAYYTIDPAMSAAENEERELELHRKQELYYSFMLLGMALVTLGGIITAGILTKVLIYEECMFRPSEHEAFGDSFAHQKGQPPNNVAHMSMNGNGPVDKTKLVDADFLAESSAGASESKSYGAVNWNSQKTE